MIPCSLTPAEASLVSDAKDLPYLEIIKGMNAAEFAAFSRYVLVDFRHYVQLQLEWLRTEKWLLGSKIQRDPSTHDLLEDVHLLPNSERFRVFYVLKYPHMVRPLTPPSIARAGTPPTPGADDERVAV